MKCSSPLLNPNNACAIIDAMNKPVETAEKPVQCFLVGGPQVKSDGESKVAIDGNLAELRALTDTLGLEVCGEMVLARLEVKPAYGMGSGMAQNIAFAAKNALADCIIFDFAIDPTKQRNWEKLAAIPVFDREEVILRIFAQRARTREAVLQVELARLQYSLPRLAHSYGDMARQRGGNYGAKGSGETQLETDQRSLRERIYKVKEELKTVASVRGTQRKKRGAVPLPQAALVGYTNAGKSSLLNSLTGANVLVEDKLFATLDPTTRHLSLKDCGNILVTDTVGFISNLPHTLVDAFKSTLEEAVLADLLLVVIDASNASACDQYGTVRDVLDEIGAGGTKRLIVLNKADKTERRRLDALSAMFSDAVTVSAKTGEGFSELSVRMAEALLGPVRSFVLPMERRNVLDDIRRDGLILKEEWLDDGIHVEARIKGKALAVTGLAQ